MSLLIPPDDIDRWFDEADNDPTKATRIAVAEMRRRADAGDAQALTQLDSWTHGGARQDLKSEFRARNQQLVIGKDVQIARHYSVKRDDGSRQLVAWVAMTRDEFLAAVDEYRKQTRTRTRALKRLVTVERLLNAHPDWTHARIAFEAAGIDPERLDKAA